MPLLQTILALDAIFAVYAASTQPNYRWAAIILVLPIIGALAYVIFEMIPEYAETNPLYHAHPER